jgi:hypothetical protein
MAQNCLSITRTHCVAFVCDCVGQKLSVRTIRQYGQDLRWDEAAGQGISVEIRKLGLLEEFPPVQPEFPEPTLQGGASYGVRSRRDLFVRTRGYSKLPGCAPPGKPDVAQRENVLCISVGNMRRDCPAIMNHLTPIKDEVHDIRIE